MPNASSLPESVRAALPDSDRRAPVEALESGGWAIAGRHALIVADESGPVDSGMWYEIARASWSGRDRALVVEWMDPARPQLRVVTESTDPRAFMRRVSDRVDHSIVRHLSMRVSNGTRVTAWIRRREDDRLFSILTAFGPLDEPSRREAESFERAMREGVGLE